MAGTPVYTIEPNPHWVVIDNFSKLPNGAVIYTYRQLNPSQFKPAFQDAAGLIPYGQPIVGNGNGTFSPIFWEFDPNNPNETYYIQVWSGLKETPGSVMLWDFQGLSGGGSGSGGGTVVTAVDLENLIINNSFYRNIGNQTGTPSLPTVITLAPSANAGLVNDPSNTNVINNGPVGPDIVFAKNNTNATDSLSFTNFSTGASDLSPDITPQLYVNYTSTSAAGETYKYIQFPICQGLQNLSGQPIAVKLFARSNSGNISITPSWRQFFGSGSGGSSDVITPVGAPITLGNTFQPFIFQSIIPSIAGMNLGSCGNDALFFQFNYPLSTACNIDLVSPSVYLGSMAPIINFHAKDFIDANMDTARTGDARVSFNSFAPYGWVKMNDGVLSNGNPAIVLPAGVPSARNNVDTFPLFDLIWNAMNNAGTQSSTPIYDGAGNPSTFGATSVADFVANKQLSLSKQLGRAIASVGLASGQLTTWLLGANTGEEKHTQLVTEMPSHNHPGSTVPFANVPASRGGGAADTVLAPGPATVNVAAQGGGQAFNVIQPTAFWNVFIKL